MSHNNDKDSLQKTLGIAALAAIIFAVIYNFLLGGRNGFGFEAHYGSTTGIDITNLLAAIVALALRLLWLALIISIIAWAVLLIKKAVEEKKFNLDFNGVFYKSGGVCPSCGENVSEGFKYCPSCRTSLKNTCEKCGTDLHPGWKCCPACGQETKPSDVD